MAASNCENFDFCVMAAALYSMSVSSHSSGDHGVAPSATHHAWKNAAAFRYFSRVVACTRPSRCGSSACLGPRGFS